MAKFDHGNQYASLCGYLDAIVDLNLKENIINEYSFDQIGINDKWQLELTRDIDLLAANKWFDQWQIVEQQNLETPLDTLSNCLQDWIFVFLGTGDAFGGFSKSGFRPIDSSFEMSNSSGRENISRKLAERFLALTRPEKVLKIAIEADRPQYVFGHCFVFVCKQQSWWLRLGARFLEKN